MDADRFRQVKAVLVEALARDDAARPAFLDAACAGDPELRREVEDLLARAGGAATLVDRGLDGARAVQALAAGLEAAAAAPPPDRIGPYRIAGVLGEGGMGVVYRGRQDEPIVREVAVKVLRRGLDTARILERFAWERQSLARMDHPHIARILDAGTAADGRPFVVLELVDGLPVTRWCREHGATLDQRLDLMIKVCRAVQHAHDRGVLHRDLKPGNVLVRSVDGQATPAIIDFGIAKALEETDVELTVAGQVVGTPAYMSPEQRAGDTANIDVRSDVYALGVMLYELLAGVRPGGDAETGATGGRPPTPRPSRAAAAAADAPVPWRGRLRGDLDRICLMAVRPEPERRYASAQALADDLQRYRAGRPVAATPDSAGYRLRMTARRHPVRVTLGTAAAAFALAGVVFLGYHADRLGHERQRALEAERSAREEAAAANSIASFLEGLLTDIDPEQGAGADVTAGRLLDDGARRLATELRDQPLVRGRLLRIMGQARHSMADHEAALVLLDSSLAAFAQVPDTMATLGERAVVHSLLGTTNYDLGHYALAEAQDRRALALSRAADPGPTVFAADLLADIATCLQAQGQTDRAAGMMREAITAAEALGQDGLASAAWARSNLGYLLYQQGRYRECVDELARALGVQRRIFPGDSIELGNTLNNLGGIERVLGRRQASERHFAEALAMYRRIYGTAHPAIARGMMQLAALGLDFGDTTRAGDLEAALAMNREILGDEHVQTTGIVLAVARLRQVQGRAAAADSLHRWVIAARESLLGPDQRRTREARGAYGRFLLESDRFAEAAAVLGRLLEDEGERLADDHPQLARLRADLAEAELALGRADAARSLLARALPRLQEVYGEESPHTRRARAALAHAE